MITFAVFGPLNYTYLAARFTRSNEIPFEMITSNSPEIIKWKNKNDFVYIFGNTSYRFDEIP